MRGLLGFICLLLIGLCVGLISIVGQTEMNAERWNRRVNAIEHVQELNRQVLQALDYSYISMEATKMLAVENGLLVERERKVVQAYSIIEEENRSLKNSLDEAVDRLEEQVEQINELIDENESLTWRVDTLERALELIETGQKKEALKSATDNFLDQLIELKDRARVITTIMPFLL